MSFDRAKKYLEKFGLDKNVMEFSTSSATVEEAAGLLHCTEGEIAKTLSFLVDEKAILVVVAGDRKIDNHKFKEEFHKKAKMIPRDILEDLVGHQAGGVCPFGICDGVMVYLDQSLQKYQTVYPACGSATSAVKLTIPELEEASSYQKWVDVCKD